MAFTRIDKADYNGKGVIGLPDAPQLSTNAMQEKFEEISLDVIIPKHNTLIDELESATGASNIGTTNGNVQSEIDAFDGKIATFNGDISQLKSDMTQAQGDIATLQSGVNTNKTDIAALQSDNTTNKADIATNKANITTLQNENTTNKANITKNANDISALQTSVTTNANNIASLQNDNTTNKADIASLKSDNVTLKGKAHVHTNKGVIDALSKDSATGNLMFEGNPISGGSGNADTYGHVKVGSVTIDASGDDTIELVAGSNVTLTPNATSKSVVISASGGGGGTSTGDMLKSDFVLPGGTGQVLSAKEADHATNADNATSANSASTATIADKAMAMFDGTNEIPTNQLMQKKDYDADDDGVVDNAEHATNADNVGNATTSVLEGLSDNSGSLNYNGNALMLEAAQFANQAKLGEFVVNQKGNVKELALHSDITTKLSKVDTTDNLSVELAKKIDKPASATNGQVLTYNGTSNEWEAQDSKGGNQHIISDAYDELKTYVAGEYCIYNNSLWKCLVQNNGQTPTEGTYWTNVSVANEIASVNSSLSNMFTSFNIPIAGTKIKNYYAKIKTNIDITKYKPISIEYTGAWCEKCFFTLYIGGEFIAIGCIQENYTIPTNMNDLKVICVINK